MKTQNRFISFNRRMVLGTAALVFSAYQANSAPAKAKAGQSGRRAPQIAAPVPVAPPPTLDSSDSKRESLGVRELFNRALGLYKQNKIEESLAAFQYIVTKYPDHSASRIFFAKILYRIDRIPESYRVFSSINLQSLDLETRFEASLAHYWMRDYATALSGFITFPEGHAFFDLANYYGAIAALKVNQLTLAQTMMEKAIVLPESLRKSRVLYRYHIRRMILYATAQGLRLERAQELEKLKEKFPEPSQSKPYAVSSGEVNANATSEEKSHLGFELIERRVMVGIKYKDQTSSYHGQSTETASIRNAFVKLSTGLFFPFGEKQSLRQSAFGLRLNATVDEEVKDGQVETAVASDSLEELEATRLTKINDQVTQTASGNAGVWLEVPTGKTLWWGAGMDLSLKYPDFKNDDLSGLREAYLRVGAKNAEREFALRYGFGMITDAKDKPVVLRHRGEVYAGGETIDFLFLRGTVSQDLYEYDDPLTLGPTALTQVKAEAFYQMPLGMTLGMRGGYSFQREFVIPDLEGFGTIVADGETFSGRLYLMAVPIDWLEFSVYQEVEKTTWVVDVAEAQSSFEAMNRSQFGELAVSLSISILQ